MRDFGFRREADEMWFLARYYEAYNANFLPTFGDNFSFRSSRIKKFRFPDPWRWYWQFVPKYRYGLTNMRCVIS
jgi:hypothetical protein